MIGKLLQLGRDGAGIIVEDSPERNVYGLAKSMLQPPDLPIEEFLGLEGHMVAFDVIDETATNVALVTTAQS